MERLWHDVSKFPTPGIPLLVELYNGSQVEAIRPSYVTTYKHDPEYRKLDDTQIPITGVKQWSIL